MKFMLAGFAVSLVIMAFRLVEYADYLASAARV